MNARRQVQLGLGLIAVACAAAPANAQTDEGVARHIPWSGYWFPIAKGELLAPLQKYDALTGGNAFRWEYARNPPGANVPEWHGYCHGWAAAAILEQEPAQQRLASARGGSVLLGVADQKAWFAASHAGDAANWFGDRYGDGQGSENPNDMLPDMLWQLLKMFLKDQRVALIMDLDPGPEVWNYPVYAYRIEYRPHPRGGGWQLAQLSLWAADDAVPPDFVGLVPHFQTYTFQFQLRGRAVVAGSSAWTEQSVQDHPDFAWYPFVARPENPELQYPLVKRLLQSSTPAGAVPTPAAPAPAAGNAPHIPGFSPPDRAPSGGEQSSPIPVSPIQLVTAIANRTSQFELDLRAEEFGKTQYAIGERLQLAGTCGQAGYLYLLYINPLGELALLYPRAGEDNRVAAGGAFRFPTAGDCLVAGPLGNHYVKAIVTRQPLLLTGLTHALPPPGDARTWQARSLRLCPTQKQLVKSLLSDFVQGKSLDGRELGGEGAVRLPGFAQDEFTFYVGPAQ